MRFVSTNPIARLNLYRLSDVCAGSYASAPHRVAQLKLESGIMRRLFPCAALIVFAAFAAAPASASDVDAAAYYELRCSTCHGVDGEGTRNKSPSLGPPLRDNPLVIHAPIEVLTRIIRHGRGGQQRVYDDAYPNMPAFDAGLVPDAAGLAQYLKTDLQQKSAPAAASDTAPRPAEEGDRRGN